MSIASTVLKVAGAALGASAVVDVARYLRDGGEGPREGVKHPSVTGWLMGTRHVLAFSARNIFNAGEVLAVRAAANDAESGARELFPARGNRRGTDNVQDAYRHVYGSASATAALINEHNMAPTDAAAFVRAAGEAHEADSLLDGAHRDAARTMDLHNNELGIALGVRYAKSAAGGDAPNLSSAVLDALRGGEALMTDGSPEWALRPIEPDDVAAAYRPQP